MRSTVLFSVVLVWAVGTWSCATMVYRYPIARTAPEGTRVTTLQKVPDVLDAALWTSAPVTATALTMVNGSAEFSFEGKVWTATVGAADTLGLSSEGVSLTSSLEKNAAHHYLDLAALDRRVLTQTRTIPYNVYTTKYRQVTRMRTVYDTRTQWNSQTQSNQIVQVPRTEYYQDSESYQEVSVAYRQETTSLTVLAVPPRNLYRFVLPSGTGVVIYPGDRNWFVQNVTALVYQEAKPFLWGNQQVSTYLIDADNDGLWNGEGDQIGTAAYTPVQVAELAGNVYEKSPVAWVTAPRFGLMTGDTLALDPSNRQVTLTDVNEAYRTSRGVGTLSVSAVPAGMSLLINGNRYYPDRKGVLSCPIQYGVYRLELQSYGPADPKQTAVSTWNPAGYEEHFEVNDAAPNPRFSIGEPAVSGP